jgi:hypothetical protein
LHASDIVDEIAQFSFHRSGSGLAQAFLAGLNNEFPHPVISSSIFIHRRVLDRHGLFFDTHWRDLGDKLWTVEMVCRGLNLAVLRRFTSSFTDTGQNMNLKPNAIRERELVMAMAPAWVRRCRFPLLQLHRLRALCQGIYWEKPFAYSIYTLASADRRVEFHVSRPTAVWWARHRGAY